MDCPAMQFHHNQQLACEKVGPHGDLYEFENKIGGNFAAVLDDFQILSTDDPEEISQQAQDLGL